MADKSRTPGGRGEVWTGTYPALFQLRQIRYFRTTYSFIHSVRRIFASTSKESIARHIGRVLPGEVNSRFSLDHGRPAML
jgi:hypothetical protein